MFRVIAASCLWRTSLIKARSCTGLPHSAPGNTSELVCYGRNPQDAPHLRNSEPCQGVQAASHRHCRRSHRWPFQPRYIPAACRRPMHPHCPTRCCRPFPIVRSGTLRLYPRSPMILPSGECHPRCLILDTTNEKDEITAMLFCELHEQNINPSPNFIELLKNKVLLQIIFGFANDIFVW